MVAVVDGGGEGWEVETETETDEDATEGALAEGLEAGDFGFEVADTEESREEKMLAGLEALDGPGRAPADGEEAVAVALVTEGAAGCARLMDAGVSRIGAAEDGILSTV